MPTNNLAPPNGSVVGDLPQFAPITAATQSIDSAVFALAQRADTFIPWGTQPAARDMQLRKFWPQEPIFASALFTTASRYASFSFKLKGPKRIVDMYMKMVNNCEQGYGWQQLWLKTLIDVFTQDNGGFQELVRTADDPLAPVIAINNLDSARCVRTGRAEAPIIYIDDDGNGHRLKWYQVLDLCDFPSPVRHMRGMQYSALTRMLRAAQILRDLQKYKSEKISGRFNRAIHIINGVSQGSIKAALEQQNAENILEGITNYLQPVIVSSLDPNANIKKETIELASLPDGFDEEQTFRGYVNQLALAFGGDFQDYAPLGSGALGSAQQSETLHLKARGKGPGLFMDTVESRYNYRGVFPNNLEFIFGEQDLSEDLDHTKLKLLRAEERAMRITSGEIDEDTARAIAVEAGDLTEEQAGALKGHTAPLPAPAAGGASGKPKVDKQEGGVPASGLMTKKEDLVEPIYTDRKHFWMGTKSDDDELHFTFKPPDVHVTPTPITVEPVFSVEAPDVHVNVQAAPPGPPPVSNINLPAPKVTIQARKAVRREIERDAEGRITAVIEKEIDG